MQTWRKQYFLDQFGKEQLGLEIGPSHSPIASRKEGYNAKTVDHANQKNLIKKYKALGIETANIEEVDYVWDGKQTLTELIGEQHKFDYVIASHVVEHTTDLITFLQDCQNLLKPGGKLCLAIPDKRYCFDYFRFPSTTGDLLEAHHNLNVRHTPGKVFDFLINAAKRGEDQAWSSTTTDKLSLVYDIDMARKKFSKAKTTKGYIDIHNWMFTPASFKLLIHDLQSLGIIRLSYVQELPTQGFEFFVTLSSRAPKLTSRPRIELADEMMEDVREMLKIDQTIMREEIDSLKQQLAVAKQDVTNIKASKRWRYTEAPAKAVSSAKRRKKK